MVRRANEIPAFFKPLYDPGTGNIDQNPLFVNGPEGNYYLSQIAAGQGQNSPCLNLGYYQAADLCFIGGDGETGCFDEYTTRTDEIGDTGVIAIGFHFPGIPPATATPTRPSGTSPSAAQG